MKFKGFKQDAMTRIADSLGYQGDMNQFDQFLKNNPDKKKVFDGLQKKASQLSPLNKSMNFATGGSVTTTNNTDGSISNIAQISANRMEQPGLPTGAMTTTALTPTSAGQFVDPASGQVSGTVAAPTTTASTTTAQPVQQTDANLMNAAGVSDAVQQQAAQTQAAQGQVSQDAQVDAAQQTETSVADIQAAQGSAILMDNPVQREIQQGELIDGVANAEKASKYIEEIDAAQATPSKKATVAGQLEELTQGFSTSNPPAWAAGAIRAATSEMERRGLGASSMAGQAILQATMESALPIAAADAQTYAKFEQQNLSNRQQKAMFAAEQRARFIGLEFDQAFQARVLNASKIADVANMNFTAEQQVALENSRAANTMNLNNLSNRQAQVMAEAAALANLDMANLNNRQQAAVQNAQNFMQMDMTNLANEQQTELFKTQQIMQGLFTDAASENAARQFNATSQNQVDQFFANLETQTRQFNATQMNAQAQFNAGQTNVVERFNAELANQRDQFNAKNRLIIDQSNAQWRREIATADTAAINRSNEINAKAVLDISNNAYNNLWQQYSDLLEFAWQSAENDADRDSEMAIANLSAETRKQIQQEQSDSDMGSAIGGLIGTLGAAAIGGFFSGG